MYVSERIPLEQESCAPSFSALHCGIEVVRACPIPSLFCIVDPPAERTKMSTAAKVTLASTTLGAVGIVALVHYQQQAEKTVSIPSCLHTYLATSLRPFPPLSSTNPSIFLPKNTHAKFSLGNARRRSPRHGTTKDQTGAAGRVRDAAAAGGGVSEGAECEG